MSEKEESGPKYSKLRLRLRDRHNWVIEGYQEGGDLIARGRYVGQEKQAKWDTINPIGYFPNLVWAAKRLLDEELRRLWPKDGWTGQDLTAIVDAAEARVLAAVEEYAASQREEKDAVSDAKASE